MSALNIAIVDDEDAFRKQLIGYLKQCASETDSQISVEAFTTGNELINHGWGRFDLIYMDIEMPGMDGLSTARHIRETDQEVGILFVTNLAQYAIHGYEVDAIDYIVKPIEYRTFAYKFRKALRFCSRRQGGVLLLETREGDVRIAYRDIFYLEKDKNYIVYHTVYGDYRERGSMSDREEIFANEGFSKCTSGCLVNLKLVDKLLRDEVMIGEKCLPISRSRKKEFLNDFMTYWGR